VVERKSPDAQLLLRAMPSAWQGGNERRSNPLAFMGLLWSCRPCDAIGVAPNPDLAHYEETKGAVQQRIWNSN